MVTKLDTSRLSSITLQNARFSARGKVWDESGRGFRGSGTNNQRQTPCRALVGSRGLTLSRGRGNAHPEALLIRTCPQSIACFQIWASKRQTCYLMELHSLYWRSNNTFLVSWRYGRKHEHWKHLQTRTIHLKDDKESWKDRLVIFFTCRRSVRKANNCDPKLEECGLGRSFQNLCHSFSVYGPPIRQTTYTFSHLLNIERSKRNLNKFLISSTRGRSYKRLLEYLFFMWNPALLNGNGEPIRVLEEGFRSAQVYEVRSERFLFITKFFVL